MMRKVLVAFALKEEFAPWRRRHRFRPVSVSQRSISVATFGPTEVYVALTGAGGFTAHRFDDVMARFTPSLGIVTGVAAGLRPDWRPGDLLAAQSVCAADAKERIPGDPTLFDLAVQCGAKPAAALITLPHIARTMGKKCAWQAWGTRQIWRAFPR